MLTYAGFMDRTDPYVMLQLGSERLRTSYKNDVRPCEKSGSLYIVLPCDLCCCYSSSQVTSEALCRLANI
jgi:hypothetical protein